MKFRFPTFHFSVFLSVLLIFILFHSFASAADHPKTSDRSENAAAAGADRQSQGQAYAESTALMEVFEQKGTPQGLEPIRVHAILTADEYGRKISYPRGLYADTGARELFVVATALKSGESTIFVFDESLYPTAILGSGRGILHPKGLAVDQAGRIYVAWIDTSIPANRSRLTIFNGAFFIRREIDISALPGAGSFEAENVALQNNNATIYLAGISNKEGQARGVLELDSEGNFKRWLVPRKTSDGFALGDDPLNPRALKLLLYQNSL